MTIQESANVLNSAPQGVPRDKVASIAASVARVAIVRTMWYPEILDQLESSARAYLKDLGVPEAAIEVMRVPGSFELPLGVKIMAEAGHKPMPLDFAIALGCIVRGETPHFDFVSGAATQGLMKVQLEQKMPVGFGVLTVDDMEQARARAEKGAEAAQAAFYMHVNKCLANWGWKE